MFGEALIGIAGFFDITTLEPIGPMNFLVIIIMFGLYICHIHYMCDHHRVVRANGMIWWHYLIYISINLITVAFIYFKYGEVDSQLTAILMATSMAVFNLAVHSTYKYHYDEFPKTTRDVIAMILFTVAGAAVMILFNGEQYALSIGALVGFGLPFADSWFKYQHGKKTAAD